MATTPPPPSLSINPRGMELVKSMWAEIAVTAVVLALRLYARAWIVRKVNWDDFWMLVAFVVTLISFILTNLAVNNGFGMHTKDLDPAHITEAIKWAFIGQVFGIMGSAFARMAFITTLLYLLGPQQKIQLWLLRAFFVGQVIMNTTTSLYILLQCRPTAGLWNHNIGAVCLPPIMQEHMGFAQGTVNSFTDLALAVFPATVIWKLNMKKSIKVSLCITMGLGVFAFATAVIKTVNLTEIASDPLDLTFIMFGLQFWFCIENCTLIISATIPTLRPLFSRRGKKDTSSYNTTGQQHSYVRHRNGAGTAQGHHSLSGASDQIELTGGVDTECVAGLEHEGRRGDGEMKVPERGIMKTVDSYVTY